MFIMKNCLCGSDPVCI